MRPYLTAATADLIDLAKAHWDDAEVLGQLVIETKHRKSKRAGMLERDLEKRIAHLAARPKEARTPGGAQPADMQLSAAKARIAELERELASTRAAGRSEVDVRLAKWGWRVPALHSFSSTQNALGARTFTRIPTLIARTLIEGRWRKCSRILRVTSTGWRKTVGKAERRRGAS